MLRIALVIIALLLVLVGFSQIAFPRAWDGAVGSMLASPLFRLWGVISIALGLVFIAGSLNKTIELRLFLWVLGWLIAIAGLAMLINPGSAALYTRAVFLDRSPDTKVAIMWLSGLLRIGLGAAIYYAVVKPDTQVRR